MRREQDLAATVEDSKSAVRIERSRLQALHNHVSFSYLFCQVAAELCLAFSHQELREKDDQLVRMRAEMEKIVHALRSYSHSNSVGE